MAAEAVAAVAVAVAATASDEEKPDKLQRAGHETMRDPPFPVPRSARDAESDRLPQGTDSR